MDYCMILESCILIQERSRWRQSTRALGSWTSRKAGYLQWMADEYTKAASSPDDSYPNYIIRSWVAVGFIPM